MSKKRLSRLCALVLAGGIALSTGVALAEKPAGRQTAPQAESRRSLEGLMRHYSSTSIGSMERQKTIRFIVEGGDIMFFRNPERSAHTITLVGRSKGTFSQGSVMSYGDEWAELIERRYCIQDKDADVLKAYVRKVTKGHDAFRLDVGYTIGEKRGAIFIYDYRKVHGRIVYKELGKRLIPKKVALSVMDYFDRVFFGPDKPIIGQYYHKKREKGCINFSLKRRGGSTAK